MPLVKISFFKVNNRNTRKRCEIYSKLTQKNSRTTSMTFSGVFIVNFEHINVSWVPTVFSGASFGLHHYKASVKKKAVTFITTLTKTYSKIEFTKSKFHKQI